MQRGISIASAHTVAQASTIAVVDAAIANLSEERASLGAVSNRLSSTVANLDQIRVNLSASQGRIEDADFAQKQGIWPKAKSCSRLRQQWSRRLMLVSLLY